MIVRPSYRDSSRDKPYPKTLTPLHLRWKDHDIYLATADLVQVSKFRQWLMRFITEDQSDA